MFALWEDGRRRSGRHALAQDTVKLDQQAAQNDLRGKMFLVVCFLVADVVLVRKRPAEVWEPND